MSEKKKSAKKTSAKPASKRPRKRNPSNPPKKGKRRHHPRKKNPGLPGPVVAAIAGVVGAGAAVGASMGVSKVAMGTPTTRALVAGGASLALGIGAALVSPAAGTAIIAGGCGGAAAAALAAPSATPAPPAKQVKGIAALPSAADAPGMHRALPMHGVTYDDLGTVRELAGVTFDDMGNPRTLDS